MRERYRNECGRKYPTLEKMHLTDGVVGGVICQLLFFIENINRVEKGMSKTIFVRK